MDKLNIEPKKALRYVAPFLFAAVAIPTVLVNLTPTPVSKLLRRRFSRPKTDLLPENYAEIKAKTKIVRDLDYHSTLANGFLDVIMPKEQSGKLPLVIWMHGGAYVGGDKRDVTNYAESIASYGYIVGNINYALAPEQPYPGPLIQLTESYLYLKEHAEEFQIDMNQVFFAGDSAGAQIVSQFLTIQTNQKLADAVDIQPVVPLETLKGALMFCGPFDIKKLGTESKSVMMNLLMNQVAWAYVGEKKWLTDERLHQVSLRNYMTDNYPPSLIADGNTLSFEEHGRDFVALLKEHDVEVEGIFFPEEVKTEHEYQFIMNSEAGKYTFERVMNFLENHRDK
ncbi:alpha/beta hydrolase [Carnobacterium gallinarum]|uniref:alpha/beta hydrolase n=1 Tax=Carnobacterium gallinarum TaxID=2749 RepID=UPI000557354B|nr:alpha/beta hydrolase [Carnobacterium gallinarum]